MRLQQLRESLAVARLPAAAPWPTWARGELVSLTRTADELSVVCDSHCVPAGITAEKDWRCLRVCGVLDFAQVGILAALALPLREAGIPIFVISTHDTDYLMVQSARLSDTLAALTRAGHEVI